MSLPRFGPRGEGWVALQAALFLLLAAAGVAGPRWGEAARPWLAYVAALLFFAGVALGLAGLVALGRQLTPWPRPVGRGRLRERGPYALVRHPLYGAVLLVGLAWTLVTSPLALAPLAGVVGVLEGKRRLEEEWLLERYPGYAAYRRRVRRRFVPWIW